MFGRRTPESGRPTKLSRAEKRVIDRSDRHAFIELEELAPLLLKGLHEKIVSGEIGTVVGFDASGRFPALIMSQCIQRIQKKQGIQGLQTRFFSGKIPEAMIPDIRAAIRTSKIDKNRTVLLVDDTFNTGHAIDSVRTAFLEEGYKVEYAVFNSTDPTYMAHKYPGALYAAQSPVLGADPDGSNKRYKSIGIYMKRSLAGTMKNHPVDSIHAPLLSSRVRYRDDLSTQVSAARKLVNATVNNILAKYDRSEGAK